MAYTPTNWASGDVVTAAKLNNIESGLSSVFSADMLEDKHRRVLTVREQRTVLAGTLVIPDGGSPHIIYTDESAQPVDFSALSYGDYVPVYIDNDRYSFVYKDDCLICKLNGAGYDWWLSVYADGGISGFEGLELSAGNHAIAAYTLPVDQSSRAKWELFSGVDIPILRALNNAATEDMETLITYAVTEALGGDYTPVYKEFEHIDLSVSESEYEALIDRISSAIRAGVGYTQLVLYYPTSALYVSTTGSYCDMHLPELFYNASGFDFLIKMGFRLYRPTEGFACYIQISVQVLKEMPDPDPGN